VYVNYALHSEHKYIKKVYCIHFPCHISLRIGHAHSIDDLIRSQKRIESIEHVRITLGRSYEAASTLSSCASNYYSAQAALHCNTEVLVELKYSALPVCSIQQSRPRLSVAAAALSHPQHLVCCQLVVYASVYHWLCQLLSLLLLLVLVLDSAYTYTRITNMHTAVYSYEHIVSQTSSIQQYTVMSMYAYSVSTTLY
jgi:hypothetical protein